VFKNIQVDFLKKVPAARRRKELLELLDRLDPVIDELTKAAEQEARKRPDVLRLMTHPGVGSLTALAYFEAYSSPISMLLTIQLSAYSRSA
jgi:transposase